MIHRGRRQNQLETVQLMSVKSMQNPHMQSVPSTRTVPADKPDVQRRRSNVGVLHTHTIRHYFAWYRDSVGPWMFFCSRGSSEDCFLDPVASFWLPFQTIAPGGFLT